MRMHLILSEDLVNRIDKVVGKRKRSRFVEEAVREKLRKETLIAAVEQTAGVLAKGDRSEWATPEGTAAWVRDTRRRNDERIDRLRRA